MPREGELTEQYGTFQARKNAAQLGMWVFLGTEILLFGGLFCAYALYRFVYPHAFHEASRHMAVTIGTINTFVLLVSSIFVALAVALIREERELLSAGCQVVAVLLGLTFLVLKGIEYSQHVHDAVLPGVWYAVAGPREPGSSLFITLYWLMTGLHTLHVTVGVGVLSVVAFRTAAGHFDGKYYLPVELGGMYWHFVDIVWVFLYPLFYLIAR